MIENAQERNVQKFMTEEEKGKHIQNQKEVSEIVDMVNDPNTPESLKEDLNSIAEQKAKEGGDFEGSVMERMDDYNMDTALSIMALDKQIMDAKRTFQSVKDNPDISDGLREEVYGKLKNKLDELQKQKKN